MAKYGDNPYRRPGSPFWQILYVDASGRKRRESTRARNRKTAQIVLDRRRREVELARHGGVVDPFAESRHRPIDELVTDYVRHLRANDRSKQYVDEAAARIRVVIDGAEIATLASISPAPVVRFLDELRLKRSAKTHANYLESVRTFGAWLVEHGLWSVNPFAFARRKRGKRRDADRKFLRLQLSWEDVQKLAESAMVRHVQAYAKAHGGRPSPRAAEFDRIGRERALLYLFAATTGLRASEIEALRWEDLRLDGDSPHLVLSGRFTKNGDDARLPLQSFIADALKDLRQKRGAIVGRPVGEGDQVLHVPERIAEHVRRDAMHAGLIPSHRPADRRVDFHSLRHSCVRILRDLGLPVEVVQRMLRHSDIRLTLQTYGRVDDERMAEAMRGVVPAPSAPSLCTLACTNSDQQQKQPGATGTKQRSRRGRASHGPRAI